MQQFVSFIVNVNKLVGINIGFIKILGVKLVKTYYEKNPDKKMQSNQIINENQPYASSRKFNGIFFFENDSHLISKAIPFINVNS